MPKTKLIYSVPMTAPCVLCGRDATREIILVARDDDKIEVTSPWCDLHLPAAVVMAQADDDVFDYIGTFDIL